MNVGGSTSFSSDIRLALLWKETADQSALLWTVANETQKGRTHVGIVGTAASELAESRESRGLLRFSGGGWLEGPEEVISLYKAKFRGSATSDSAAAFSKHDLRSKQV